jgi:hypothetical protein
VPEQHPEVRRLDALGHHVCRGDEAAVHVSVAAGLVAEQCAHGVGACFVSDRADAPRADSVARWYGRSLVHNSKRLTSGVVIGG